MISRITDRFRQCLGQLPKSIRRQAREAYKTFIKDPYHPSLHFKRVHPKEPVYSVRVSRQFRAVGVLSGGEIVWFWIGSHSEYDKLIANF